MDPIFGLPCVQDSRAMDSARTRNQSQEKMLAVKFENLDLDMKTRSGKLITQKNEIEDFLSQLDPSSSRQIQLPAGLSKRERAIYRKMAQCAGMTSITLAEFDRQRKQKAAHPMHVGFKEASRAVPICLRGVAIHQSQDKRKAMRLQHIETQDSNDECTVSKASLVVAEDLELCLPMNRQKHAVRDVWSRITSDDMRHKIAIKKAASSLSLATQTQHKNKVVMRQRKTGSDTAVEKKDSRYRAE